jgi:secreted trypsin-like serine protease
VAALALPSPAIAIIGGSVPPGHRPEVLIVGSRGNSCTGTLLARDIVLSAAHCVVPGADYKLVEFDAQRRPALRDVAKIERHPQFSMETFLNHRATADLALLKLSQPVAKVTPASLRVAALPVAVGDRLTVTGYGLAERGNGKSGGTLRAAELIATGKPGNLQIRLVDPVTRGEHTGLGACTGDSGGPAFAEVAGRLVIIGVVSWSTGPNMTEGCGGLTGITPVSLYGRWILETAKKLGSPIVASTPN